MRNDNLSSFPPQKEILSKRQIVFPKKFISRKEMAGCLGLSLSSVARGLKSNIPPFDQAIRIGRRVLFPVSCLENLSSWEVKYEKKIR